MHPTLRKIELLVDKSIPYLLVVLIIITLVDVFHAEVAKEYLHTIEFVDNAVIAFFIADLAFKYKRAQNTAVYKKQLDRHNRCYALLLYI